MVRDYGDRALLIECTSTTEVLAITEALGQTRLPGVVDIVPGANRHIMAVNTGLTVTDPAGHGVGLCALDNSLYR